MYLSTFRAQNLKCFEDVSLEFPADAEGSRAGWHVLLGVNGTGKSTLLQAMALTLVGPTIGSELLRLHEREKWIRRGADYVTLEAEIERTPNDDALGRPTRRPYKVTMHVTPGRSVTIDDAAFHQSQIVVPLKRLKSLNAGPYSERRGWFSAGYGPFRRLSGGGQEDDQRLAWEGGIAGAYTTLYRESAALTRCEPWLMTLHNQANDPALDDNAREWAEEHLEHVRAMLNSLLPMGIQLGAVSSQRVTFVNRGGVEVELGQLSDGFRSFLALTIDLLRYIISLDEFGSFEVVDGLRRVDTEGVVFIDEADAHLHPTWQRILGERLCQVFPQIQFIVSTHSPFVAQAARPGALYVLENGSNGKTRIRQSEASVRGWRADQILLSPLFGLTSTRDPETERDIARRTELLGRPALTPEEQAELDEVSARLRAQLSAPGDTLEEQDAHRAMMEYVRSRRGGAR